MDKTSREGIAAAILARSNADQTEVLVGSSDRALTRFTHEASNQNVAAYDVAVSVRAIVEGKTGVARTNRVDDASLSAVATRAIELARLAPPDPMLPPLPNGGETTSPAGARDDATARANAGVRASMCDAVFRAAERSGYWCAGYASTAADGVTVANSSGALSSFDGTDAALNVKMTGADSTGFAEMYAPSFAAIDAEAIGALAAEKTRASASPRSVEPGDWTVVLEPTAFGELFTYIADHFSAQSFQEGSSFLSDGLGKKYFSDGLTVYDDYTHPLSPGMPFDFEGQPKQRVTLIERGVVKNVVTDSYYAKVLDRENTGHALPAPNAAGPQALNVVVAGGPKSTAQLVEETKRGILVTRFWYIRTVDRKKAIVTGMTRDGTFLIENGKIVGGVRNLRFNQSIVEALAHCEVGSEQRRTGGYDFSMVSAPAKIEGFRFSSTTLF